MKSNDLRCWSFCDAYQLHPAQSTGMSQGWQLSAASPSRPAFGLPQPAGCRLATTTLGVARAVFCGFLDVYGVRSPFAGGTASRRSSPLRSKARYCGLDVEHLVPRLELYIAGENSQPSVTYLAEAVRIAEGKRYSMPTLLVGLRSKCRADGKCRKLPFQSQTMSPVA